MNKPVEKQDLLNSTTLTFKLTSPEKLDEANKPQSTAFGRTCKLENKYPSSPEDDNLESDYIQQYLDASGDIVETYNALEEGLFKEQIDIDIKDTDAKRIESDIKQRLNAYLENQKGLFNRKRRRYIAANLDVSELKEALNINQEPLENNLPKRLGHAFTFSALEVAITAIFNVSGGVAPLPAISTGIGITILNIFLFGFVACAEIFPRARKVNSSKTWPLWLVVGIAITVFTFCVNSIVAHYRSEHGDIGKALEAFKHNPFGFSSMQGYLLMGMGLLVCAVAGVLFYTARDPIFKFGEAGEKRRKALDEVNQVAPKARAGLEKHTAIMDKELVSLEDIGTKSFKQSQKLTYRAKRLWKKAISEIGQVRQLYERATGLHRRRMTNFWGNIVPDYYNHKPDLAAYSTVIDAAHVEADFKESLDGHEREFEKFNTALQDARDTFSTEREAVLDTINSDLVMRTKDKEMGHDDG